MDLKIILAALVILVSAGIYYEYQKQESSLIDKMGMGQKEEQSHLRNTEITPQEDIHEKKLEARTSQELVKKLETGLSIEQRKSNEWSDIHNFTISAENFFKPNHDSEIVLNIIQTGLDETLNCISVDFCGARPEPSTGYFDPNRTPAHITIIRLLDIKLHNFKKFDHQISKEALLKVLRLNQPEIIERALQLLAYQITESEWGDVLDISKTWTGETSKVGMIYLSQYILRGTNRRELINQARLKIETAPPFTAISVLEGLYHSGTVDQREYEILAKSSCHFKSKARHNWLAVRKNLELIAAQTHTSYDLIDICP